MDTKAYCTQGRDQECGEDNCCLGVKDVPKHIIGIMATCLAKQIDNDIVNWSVSCEK